MLTALQIKTQSKTLSALLCLFALLVSSSLHAQVPRFADAVGDATLVLDLIERRLSLMPEVAAWKWHAEQPVADEERELQVLEQSVTAAEAIGLDKESARNFFAVQIRMARAVQEQHIKRWRTQSVGQVPVGRNLATEIRPELDSIGRDLLSSVYLASSELARALGDPRILDRIARLKQHSGVDDALLTDLRSSLAAIRIVSPATLSRIKRVGVLRIGTTGDYAPFSSERDGVLSGFDVNLAVQLAQHWGVSIKFVRTAWPTLMDDFKRHRFDIAISGISITPERSAQASFSIAYHADGKMPIARCKDAAKYATLEKIDKPAVRVIENPGGTNERFARERIKRATIVIHSDNRTVFDEIVSGKADIMFTDSIEVDLQTRRHPQLCPTMTLPLTEAKKAIMLPNQEWEGAVNDWLGPRVESGQVRTELEQALIAAQ